MIRKMSLETEPKYHENILRSIQKQGLQQYKLATQITKYPSKIISLQRPDEILEEIKMPKELNQS